MKNKSMTWIIVIFVILLGLIIFGIVMEKLNWNFTKLSIVRYETNSYKIIDNFIDIEIVSDTSDIEFVPSDNSNSLVVSYEDENMNHSVKVINNKLLIDVVNTKKWYEYIGLNFDSPKITVYMPKGEYGNLLINSSTSDVSIPRDFIFKSIDVSLSTGDVTNYASVFDSVKIKTSTGDMNIENIAANMLDFSTSTGRIDIINVNIFSDIKVDVSTGKTNIVDTNCKNIISSGDTGDMFMTNVIATEKFFIKRDTGDIRFKACDARDIFVKTDTGDVTGNFLTDKVIFAQSNTGNIDVPKLLADEKCEIITDTGDIKLTID